MATMVEQANVFEQTLVRNEMKYTRKKMGEMDAFSMDFGGGNFTFNHVTITVIFDEDGTTAHLMSSVIASIPEAKTAAAIAECNYVNNNYRWLKFYVDSDNDVIGDFDMNLNEIPDGEPCYASVARAVSVIDDVYGNFMKLIWAD